MLSKVLEFITGDISLIRDKTGHPLGREELLAVATLLLEMAGADEDFAPEEVQTCFRAMEKYFEVSENDTLGLMEEAHNARQARGSFEPFLETINATYNEKQKTLLLAIVWKVVLADNVVEQYEQRFAAELRQKLNLPREAADEAKNAAIENKV